MAPETIPIIYQDHHLLIVNKPAGLVIHPTYKHADGTMWDALLVHLAQQGSDDWQPPELPDEPEWARAPLYIQEMLRARRTERQWKEDGLLPRPCLLHRLDKDTSGIVALARTERSRRHLIRQFHEHTIVKRYLAVVHKGAPDWSYPRTRFTVTKRENGKDEVLTGIPPSLLCSAPIQAANEASASCESPPGSLAYGQAACKENNELILDGPLQRDPVDRRRCIVGPDGQVATTILKVLAVSEGEKFALLEVQPVTGRTHQIRAHLAALGYAIVGDQVYAPPAEQGTSQAALKRQFLHACSLELRRYPDNSLCTFAAPLAGDLASWMKSYFPMGLGVIDASSTVPA